ncbi:hypothetical protein RsTz2092_00620 [Deferribacterales bacterium RsTz2092]|nr:hypothetical protein AGMMS49941_01090 [Deferribacterales bacterium]
MLSSLWSKVKALFFWALKLVWAFVKSHPLWTLLIVCVCAVFYAVLLYEALHLTSMPTFCKLCHPQQETGPFSEYHTWSKNVHSLNNVECLDCHSSQPGALGYMGAKMGGLYDLAMHVYLNKDEKLERLQHAELNRDLTKAIVCMHCHSDSANEDNRKDIFMTFGGVAMRELDAVVNPSFRQQYNLIDIENSPVRAGVEPNHAMHIAQGVNCATCHVKVAHSGEYKAKLNMQTCFTCHDEKRDKDGAEPVANDDCERCHVNQVALQEGVIGDKELADKTIEWKSKHVKTKAGRDSPSARWYMRDLGCQSCHADPFEHPKKEDCNSCHSEGYGDMMTDWQADFDERSDKAIKFLRDNMPSRKRMNAEKLAILAKYETTFDLILKDGSRGVHNPDYVSAVFDKLDKLQKDFDRELYSQQ